MTTAFQSNAFQTNAFQIDAVVAPSPPAVGAGTGGSGGGGGGAHWERASSNHGAKPGQLSVKEQNKKELREAEAIEREIARQEAITAKRARDAELKAELESIKALTKDAGIEAKQVTAMAAAFARAGLVMPAVQPDLIDEEEEEILLLMAIL